MHADNTFTSHRRKDRPALLVICLLFSILLHLAVVLLLPYDKLTSEELLTEKQQPTIVRLVDKPKIEQPKSFEYELDQKPLKPTPETPEQSSRLAEQNQRVEKETAPEGDDTRDQKARIPSASTQPTGRQQQPVQKQVTSESAQKSITEKAVKPSTTSEKTDKQQQVETEERLPTLDQLTSLPANTVGRIVQREIAARERIKERADIETGDTVWLNLTQGRLISFFRRFRDQIEGVWNYPREALEKEQQGTLQLKITVDRDGKLIDVDLLQTSGSEILDFEAIQAVYRAAPFGPLGRNYPYPDLKIMAHFSYRISGKYIYGRNR
ncbi:energy transducer TonB [Malonomonas rubra]|nr:energy transducer TonB [Malonomonas rubra]